MAKKVSKRNPQDSTTRNVRAANKKIAALDYASQMQASKIDQQYGWILELDSRVNKLELKAKMARRR